MRVNFLINFSGLFSCWSWFFRVLLKKMISRQKIFDLNGGHLISLERGNPPILPSRENTGICANEEIRNTLPLKTVHAPNMNSINMPFHIPYFLLMMIISIYLSIYLSIYTFNIYIHKFLKEDASKSSIMQRRSSLTYRYTKQAIINLYRLLQTANFSE